VGIVVPSMLKFIWADPNYESGNRRKKKKGYEQRWISPIKKARRFIDHRSSVEWIVVYVPQIGLSPFGKCDAVGISSTEMGARREICRKVVTMLVTCRRHTFK
jgi:hypothetical protein